MINKKAYLNKSLFTKDVEQIPTRNGYGDGLLALGEKNIVSEYEQQTREQKKL